MSPIGIIPPTFHSYSVIIGGAIKSQRLKVSLNNIFQNNNVWSFTSEAVHLYGAVLRCRNKMVYGNMSYEVGKFWQEGVLRNLN
jgi:hypothetical protein